MKVDTQLLLNLGMDGPSVNLSFPRELNIEPSKNSSSFLSIVSWPLHTVNNAFGKGMAALSNVINLDQFAIDIHFFFKLSSARREDLNNVSSITGVTIEYVIRHSQIRWLSIECVLVRVHQQFNNLCEYFLRVLPKLAGFKGKNGVAQTDRYQRIVLILKNDDSRIYMLFVVFVSSIFREFMVPLQSSEPKIHLLHSKMLKLIKNFLDLVIQSTHWMVRKSYCQLKICVKLMSQMRRFI